MTKEKDLIEIDGASGSGGGQILRTATALSAISQKPCRVFNIRASRQKPGLGHQHLLGLHALSQLCHGDLEGDRLGSTEIVFWPGPIEQGSASLNIKIETAASITLILQSLIPVALFAPKPVEIKFEGGATETFFSPTLDYFQFVFLKLLEKFNQKIEIEPIKRGYYPEGGAKIKARIAPASKIKPVSLTERGELKKILVLSGAAKTLEDKKVAERQIAGVREVFGKLKLPLEERIEYYPTQCPGSQICLISEFEHTIMGTDNLGKLGKRAERVGREAAISLLKEEKSGACLDRHMADQILPYLALAQGKSHVTVSEITEHCKTNSKVIEKFLPGKFAISPLKNGSPEGTKSSIISWLPDPLSPFSSNKLDEKDL